MAGTPGVAVNLCYGRLHLDRLPLADEIPPLRSGNRVLGITNTSNATYCMWPHTSADSTGFSLLRPRIRSRL